LFAEIILYSRARSQKFDPLIRSAVFSTFRKAGLWEIWIPNRLCPLHFPEIDKRRVSSNNALERIILEIRRRSRVIGAFPNQESYVHLITRYLIEYSEDWINERSYIKQDKLIIALDEQENLMEAQVY
jgi:transposase-like protein